jgi:thioredoxin 1
MAEFQTGSGVVEVADADFGREVLGAREPVLVSFGATWCAPCAALAPVLEGLARHYQGAVKVAHVDVARGHAVAQQYGIRSLPTLLLFVGGRVVEQIGGAVPRARLDASLRRVLECASARGTGPQPAAL